METRTRMLNRAAEIWQRTLNSTADQRLELAHELADMEIFSHRQIAKIARMSTTTLGRKVENRGSGGGRFEPSTLSALAVIREMVIDNKPLPMALIQATVKDGTSLSNLCRLTGAPRASLYNRIKED